MLVLALDVTLVQICEFECRLGTKSCLLGIFFGVQVFYGVGYIDRV